MAPGEVLLNMRVLAVCGSKLFEGIDVALLSFSSLSYALIDSEVICGITMYVWV
jgi:hypothetical protein